MLHAEFWNRQDAVDLSRDHPKIETLAVRAHGFQLIATNVALQLIVLETQSIRFNLLRRGLPFQLISFQFILKKTVPLMYTKGPGHDFCL